MEENGVLIDIYRAKDQSYYQHVREDLTRFIPKRPGRILDIGCGLGLTARYIKDVLEAESVCGIELFPEVADRARSNLDLIIVGSCETIDPPEFAGLFDVVVAGDVIEHLIHPEKFICKCYRWLKPSGFVIGSVPNFIYWKNLKNIFAQRDIQYQDGGILDNSHLRFFAKKSITRIFSTSGFLVEKIEHENLGLKSRIFNRLSFDLFDEYLPMTWYILARKPSEQL